jgi:hypothetical protein
MMPSRRAATNRSCCEGEEASAEDPFMRGACLEKGNGSGHGPWRLRRVRRRIRGVWFPALRVRGRRFAARRARHLGRLLGLPLGRALRGSLWGALRRATAAGIGRGDLRASVGHGTETKVRPHYAEDVLVRVPQAVVGTARQAAVPSAEAAPVASGSASFVDASASSVATARSASVWGRGRVTVTGSGSKHARHRGS